MLNLSFQFSRVKVAVKLPTMRVTELIAIISKLIKELDRLDDTFYYLKKEMEGYEVKKNLAKTVGTVIGVAGTAATVVGAFFTGGLTLLASGVGASIGGAVVNGVTDWVDGKECQEFNTKIRTQTAYFNGISKELNEKTKEISDIVNELIKKHPQLDTINALFITMSTNNLADLLQLSKIESLLVVSLGKLVQAPILLKTVGQSKDFLRLANLLGIPMVKAGGAAGKGAAAAAAGFKVAGKVMATAGAVLGVVVSVIEVVSILDDWFSDHQTVKAAEKIRDDLQKTGSNLKEFKENLLSVEEEIYNGKYFNTISV